MSYPFFAYMSRLKYIARWGLMRSTIPENDAEHTLQTAMIAHALAIIRQDIFHEQTDPEHCAMLALYHDASEVFTGDLPTPVKYFTPASTKSMRRSRQKPGRNSSRHSPKNCSKATHPISSHLSRILFGLLPKPLTPSQPSSNAPKKSAMEIRNFKKPIARHEKNSKTFI